MSWSIPVPRFIFIQDCEDDIDTCNMSHVTDDVYFRQQPLCNTDGSDELSIFSDSTANPHFTDTKAALRAAQTFPFDCRLDIPSNRSNIMPFQVDLGDTRRVSFHDVETKNTEQRSGFQTMGRYNKARSSNDTFNRRSYQYRRKDGRGYR